MTQNKAHFVSGSYRDNNGTTRATGLKLPYLANIYSYFITVK